MTVPSKPLAIGGVVLGGSAAAAGGTHLGTNQTVKDAVGIDLMDETNADEEWKIKVTSAKTDNALKSKIFKTSNNNNATKDRKDLFEWCKEQSEKSYGSALSSKDEATLKNVKHFCSLTIKEKLGTEWLFSLKNDESDLRASTKKLSQTDTNNPLNAELTKIKDASGDKADNWEDLRRWCLNSYSKGYKSSSDSLWKLVDKFCKKPKILDRLEGSISVDDTSASTILSTKATSATTTAKDEDLRTKLSSANGTSPTKSEVLKKWCQEQKEKVHDSKLKDNSSLLEEVKKWCVVLIEDKLDSTKKGHLQGDNKNNEWTAVAKTLHDYPQSGATNEFSSFSDLMDIKTKVTSQGSNFQPLKTWCEATYKKFYKNDSDLLFKAASKFCQKDS